MNPPIPALTVCLSGGMTLILRPSLLEPRTLLATVTAGPGRIDLECPLHEAKAKASPTAPYLLLGSSTFELGSAEQASAVRYWLDNHARQLEQIERVAIEDTTA